MDDFSSLELGIISRTNAFAGVHLRHADHKTIVLQCWHEVAMNTEHQSIAMRSVAFID